jgi:hypothetical protein
MNFDLARERNNVMFHLNLRVHFGSVATVLLAGFLCSGNIHAAAIDVLIGDKNGFGFSPACSDTGTCTNLSVPSFDNRTAAEMAGTDGSQITDVYSAIFPGEGPNTTSVADVVFSFSGMLTSGTLSFAGGDFQADVFGPLTAAINGTSVPFSFADGRFVTAIHSFTLTAPELAAANSAGEVILHLDRSSSGDFVSFDWFELTGSTSTAPEPSSVFLLLGGALAAGFATARRRLGLSGKRAVCSCDPRQPRFAASRGRVHHDASIITAVCVLKG